MGGVGSALLRDAGLMEWRVSGFYGKTLKKQWKI